MGSFAGANIDAQNLEQAISLAQQKEILAQQLREYQLSQSLADYRNSLPTMVSDVKIAMPQNDSSNNVFVPKKPYLVVQEFNIKNFYNDWKTGKEVFQELPITKGGVILFPTGSQQDQYDLALKEGKLQPLDIVTVESLVDKQDGYCQKESYNYGDLRPAVMRPPCRTVKKGEILKGYVVLGNFTHFEPFGFQEAKPVLSFNEFKVFNGNDKSNAIENSIETKKENENKLTIMIVGAFILGFLLSKD
jgi:hypothetical protein